MFACLLFACAAAPVFADSAGPASEGSNPSAPEADDDPERYFDGRVVPVDLGAVEREEREREEWLASPEAVEQRRASWAAYGDSSPADSEELLRTVFAEQMATLNGDPARFISDAQLVKPLDETAAAVNDDGDRSLLDATIPLRVENEQGDLAKVDLSLTRTPQGYETVNAVSDLRLPLTGGGETEVGERGFAISQAQAEDSPARLFGDKNLFYPDVLPDTDLMVSPTGTGVELFNLLRSKESPEEFRFEIDLPAAAVLRAGEYGGAEVVRDGETLNRIAPPFATDAQGTDVPVEMTVEQSAIVLHVAHREADFAAPILLDPIVENWATTGHNWHEGQNLAALTNGAWVYKSNNSQIGHDICCYGGDAGLLTWTQKNVFYGSEQHGQWSYSTPNYAVFVVEGWVVPFWRAVEGCGSSVQPHDYVGFLEEPGEKWGPVIPHLAKNGEANVDGKGQAFIIGLGSGPPGVWIPCNRYIYAGGVALWLDDIWGTAVSATNVPTQWIGDKKPSPITVKANDNGTGADDDGLGIREVKLTLEGKGVIAKDEVGHCTGLYGNTCPTVRYSPFNVTGDSFLEGIRTLGVVAEDPTGRTGGSQFEVRVDNSVPEVALSGQLAEATGEEVAFNEEEPEVTDGEDKLRLPVYKLKIEAKDGVWGTTDDKEKRSGVKDIEVWLDGKEKSVPWDANSSCPQTSCEMNETYTLNLTGLSPGAHKLEVKVEDFVEEIGEREIEFEYFPATGMKDEYVMHHFPLPNGQGDEDEEEHPARPELAVNVMNGNLVYRERDIDVEGTAQIDLEVERYYNSMLPDSENTEWGDGWTLAQTPDLEPVDTGGSPAPDEAQLIDQSGALREGVELPAGAGATKFDPALQATLTKRSSGGYELADETGEAATSVVFDEAGQTEARVTEGYAKVDYRYEGGDLAEIEVTDPSTFAADPEDLQIPEPPPFSAPSFAYSFGLFGDDEGEFEAPADVAVGPEGDIWVVDAENERIQHFSRFGQYLDEFGAEGYGDGQLRHPVAIEIDQDENLWVLDSYNDRVQKFNQQGEFLAKWGTYGSAAGQLNTPEGMAIDAAGDFWIADTLNDRLQKFSETGALLKVAGASGPGDLSEPLGLDVGPGGEVFVADKVDNRVVAFDKEGSYLRHFGSAGYGEGQFHGPLAVEVDTRGSVWVLDGSDEQLEQFDTQGDFIAQFGSEGAGQGEFEFERPAGITADARGGIWIVDSGNYRMQRWVRGDYRPSYEMTVGSSGATNGKFDLPGDIDIDSQGDIWVADTLNNRVQQLDPEGKFISKFGAVGSGNGQLKAPSAIEIDAQDNIWVADAGNDRLQKFNQAGQLLAMLGGSGTTAGKLDSPEGIAIDQTGDIWVADTWNDRVQRFSATGAFEKAFGASGEGQLSEPMGLDVLHGEVFVADQQNHRVAVFDQEGEYLREFGAFGYGLGQFRFPNALEIDDSGNIWVGDEGNERILQFNVDGEFITDFGAEGTGEGEFELTSPSGVATDPEGGIWVTDSANDRLQRWESPGYVAAPEPELTDGDPEVELETPGGLVASVSGNAAGAHDYEHEGELLVSHDGPDGETDYDYEDERLTKITLPNGTWGQIAYHADGRVKSVTVAPEGSNPKATFFSYSDDPRRTTVTPSDAPQLTYDIGADGSVLKWWHTEKPPLLDLDGSLYDNREKPGGLFTGDHWLQAEAISAHGIASVDVIASGTDLVDEKDCEENLETPKVECEKVINEWVTATELQAPGHLNLEVIATDRLGKSTSERFWVDIPQPPPPPALGTPIAPKFRDIAKFREEYGLEVVFPVPSELELNERISELIKDWHEPHTPAGQYARATMARWGVPLRPADVAEMEYREWFYHVNAERIDEWVEETSPSSYAGYYINHPAGGIMHVGFIDNQDERLESLKTALSLVAGERLQVYPTIPTASYLSVQEASQSVSNAIESNATLGELVVNVREDEAGKAVRVGTPDVAQVKSILDQMLGPNAPIVVEYDAGGGSPLSGRFRNSGRMRAGDNIVARKYKNDMHVGNERCTAGFGAKDKAGEVRGDTVWRWFVLTAGHCTQTFFHAKTVYRSTDADHNNEVPWREVGHVARDAFSDFTKIVRTDAEAIRVDSADIVPQAIFGWGGSPIPTGGAGKIRKGYTVCFSGARTQIPRCGPVVARSTHWKGAKDGIVRGGYWVKFSTPAIPGDSGAPVWTPAPGSPSIGLVTAGRPEGSLTETLVEPLLHPPNMASNVVPGILHHPLLQPLSLKLGR